MAKLLLHDTLTREKREVIAADGERLRFYCCGPTVYGPAHIGNFRTFIVQDLFRRVVELSGLLTKHVRNITDVDDKTIRESQNAGKSLGEFTRHWLDRFHADCEALNLLPPDVEPSAVDHVPEQIQLIEQLLATGHAYQGGDGSVYFKVASFDAYGKLSHLDKRDLQLGISANDADEYEKENLADFALWKARKPEDGDNFWPSPWGEGRPGWHLECSAMGMKYLGESFDLHSGGVDLCFPHHDNEIAQSEAATGKEFARHWFHSEHLMVEGEKMSKSKGNLYTLSEIAERGYTAAELRFAMLAGQYRQKLNFTWDGLRSARINLQRIGAFAHMLEQAGGKMPDYHEIVAEARQGKTSAGDFAGSWEALLDNLNTPEAIGRLITAIKSLEKRASDEGIDAPRAAALLANLAVIVHAFGWELPSALEPAVPDEIKALAEQRWDARQAKDWGTSDSLREDIAAKGWQVKDGKDGYSLTPIQ